MNELIEFSLDTENPEKNYNLAQWYENQNQYAPAHTYYFRTAERSTDDLLSYKSLLRSSFCYKSQGSRDATEKVALENALNLLPQRPEAYYFLSLLYEKNQEWQNCYTYANLGLQCYNHEVEDLDLPEYKGKHLLIFQKAVSSWWWGKGTESRDLFQLLLNECYELLDDKHKDLLNDNFNRLGLNISQKTNDYIEICENNISSKIIEILNEYDINGFPKDGYTDKFTTHSYLNIYTEILSEYYNKNGTLLEVGCWHGGSILLWSKLLKNFNIVGLDIHDVLKEKIKNILNNSNNIEFIFENAYTEELIQLLKNKYENKFDIIIDDGPHTEESQIDFIKLYFPLVKDGGTLVIEDIQSYDSIEKFKQILNIFNNYDYEIKIYDHRHIKDRYDDLVFVVKKKGINKSKIPILGVPIVNGVHWLKRLIESIDYPIEELFIVNNNGRDQITDELNELIKINHPFVDKIRVCHLPHNLGVSGSWNLIIKSYIMSPYWIICNNDVAFTPGFLKEMVNKSTDAEVGMVHSSFGYKNLGSYECFLIKDFVVEKCGLFDENLYPAYAEDCDYILKTLQNKIKKNYCTIPFYHGETLDYSASGSQTWRLDSNIRDKISHAHFLNKDEYLNKKWGDDWDNNLNVDYNPQLLFPEFYNLAFNRKKYLGF